MVKRTRHSSITLPLAVIILIIIFSVGIEYILGEKARKEQPQQVSYDPAIAPSAMPTEADKIVQDYYNWYTMCLNQHFTDNYGRSPQEDCPYNEKGLLTKDLLSKLQQAKNFDPILCAQNTPEKVTYENAIINPNGSATVVVHRHWGAASPTHNVYIWVVGKKIADISCN